MDDFDHILNWKLKAGSHPFRGKDGGTCINEAALVAAGVPARSPGRGHAEVLLAPDLPSRDAIKRHRRRR